MTLNDRGSPISVRSEKFASNGALPKDKVDYKMEIVWKNVVTLLYVHLTGLYGLYLLFFQTRARTILWFVALIYFSGLGITAGAHRLWSHRSYKAKWPLRFILMIFNTMAFQDSIYVWVRDHRAHHKFVDTDADPYNSRRGFFFSHVGWLLVRKHPEVARKGALVDCSDLEQDSLVIFQKRWYEYLMPLFGFILPAVIPWWLWGENLWQMWNLSICKYCIGLNGTWAVNSAAHIWGTKPYNKSLSSTNNAMVSIFAFGEGWHNYHHVFPWDYKTSEFGNYRLNFTTAFIDFVAYLGLAYDLKAPIPDMIKKRVLRLAEENNKLNE